MTGLDLALGFVVAPLLAAAVWGWRGLVVGAAVRVGIVSLNVVVAQAGLLGDDLERHGDLGLTVRWNLLVGVGVGLAGWVLGSAVRATGLRQPSWRLARPSRRVADYR